MDFYSCQLKMTEKHVAHSLNLNMLFFLVKIPTYSQREILINYCCSISSFSLMTPKPRLPGRAASHSLEAITSHHVTASAQSRADCQHLFWSLSTHWGLFLFPKANDVSVFSRTSNKRDRVRNHGKPSVKHQEASWQKPWSYAAHYQGDPWRFLQAVQRKTGKSAPQWLFHLGEWLKTPKATIYFFIQCRKPLICQPVSFISLKCPWKSIILIYFLIYKSRDDSKVQNSTTESLYVCD